MREFDISINKNIHFVGIGGCGMSAIAKILNEKGFNISGSDARESVNTMRLRDAGVNVHIGHDESNLRGVDIVVFSAAIPKDNVELVEAKTLHVPVHPRASLLAWIMNSFKTRIAIAGTHGKTTTTSMVSNILEKCGMDPTFLIGGEANHVDGNAKLGKGEFVVAEADESDGSFLMLKPTIAVILNVEADHVDHWGSAERIVEAFIEFADKVPDDGIVVLNGDHPNSGVLLDRIKTSSRVTYGFEQGCDLRAENMAFDRMNSEFDVVWRGKIIGRAGLSVPGKQNISNALASIAVGLHLGLDFRGLSDALRCFTGVRRRFDVLGTVDEIMIVDDYAHHPTEIKATLEAVRLGWNSGKRLICVFQPHRYTRTMYLSEEFKGAFSGADMTVITDVYSAGEAPIKGVSGRSIIDDVHGDRQNPVQYVSKKGKIADFLLNKIKIRANDIIVFAGAGDIHNVGKEVLARLKERKSGSA